MNYNKWTNSFGLKMEVNMGLRKDEDYIKDALILVESLKIILERGSMLKAEKYCMDILNLISCTKIYQDAYEK